MSDIVDRLNTLSDIIMMGEKIAWGSDSAIMREAAAEIEKLRVTLAEAEKKAERDYLRFVDADREEITRLREENARLEERNKKLNADLLKQAELTAVTMTRCADLMPAQLAVVKLKGQQAEIEQLRKENARLRKLLFDFEKFQEIYEKAMETK